MVCQTMKLRGSRIVRIGVDVAVAARARGAWNGMGAEGQCSAVRVLIEVNNCYTHSPAALRPGGPGRRKTVTQ